MSWLSDWLKAPYINWTFRFTWTGDHEQEAKAMALPQDFPKLLRPVGPTIGISAPFGERGPLWDWTLDDAGIWHNHVICKDCQGPFNILDLNSKCPCGKRDGLGQHKGVDFRAPIGTIIFAMLDGLAEAAGYENPANVKQGFGLRVRQSFSVGNQLWHAFYGHFSQLHIHPGDKIVRGQMIGLSGGSGHVSGPHCHVEIRSPAGQQVPLEFSAT